VRRGRYVTASIAFHCFQRALLVGRRGEVPLLKKGTYPGPSTPVAQDPTSPWPAEHGLAIAQAWPLVRYFVCRSDAPVSVWLAISGLPRRRSARTRSSPTGSRSCSTAGSVAGHCARRSCAGSGTAGSRLCAQSAPACGVSATACAQPVLPRPAMGGGRLRELVFLLVSCAAIAAANATNRRRKCLLRRNQWPVLRT
jgi:hypothetical protein